MALHVGWGSRRMLVALSAGSVKEGKPRGHTQDTGRAGSGGGSAYTPRALSSGAPAGDRQVVVTGPGKRVGMGKGRYALGRPAVT